MDRRDLIKSSLASAGVLYAATPSQPEGPFHPLNIDNDLRRIKKGPMAKGRQIEIVGQVTGSANSSGLDRVFIEIWQADANGKYFHPNDPLELDPDPHFQFWGRATTDFTGKYRFFSIKPGSYPAASDWTRPPHIHLIFNKRGYQQLTTQLYFKGEPLNEKDRLLAMVPAQDRHKLLVNLTPRSGKPDLGVFNVELDEV